VLLGLFCVGAGFLAVKFVLQNALGYLHWDAARYGRYWPVRQWMLLHVVGGMVALLCGPLQLWSGLRGTAGRWHRWRGRLYATGVLAGCAGAFWIALTRPAFPGLGVALTALGAAWLATTLVAVVAIKRGDVEQHKQWMIRSYVVTFAFVTFRFWFDLPVLTSLSVPDRYAAIGWLCWVAPLMVTELILQARAHFASRPAAARA
jgi:uncharacterized membrane protein